VFTCENRPGYSLAVSRVLINDHLIRSSQTARPGAARRAHSARGMAASRSACWSWQCIWHNQITGDQHAVLTAYNN
jgi:hypothetical protein